MNKSKRRSFWLPPTLERAGTGAEEINILDIKPYGFPEKGAERLSINNKFTLHYNLYESL